MLDQNGKPFKAPLIAGRVVGYSEISPDMRHVDLIVVESYSLIVHPVHSHDTFCLERKDMIDPTDWNNIDGQTIIHGVVTLPREQQLKQSLVLPHSKASPQDRLRPRFTQLSSVVFIQDNGGGGGRAPRTQPQMEMRLPHLRYGK